MPLLMCTGILSTLRRGDFARHAPTQNIPSWLAVQAARTPCFLYVFFFAQSDYFLLLMRAVEIEH